MKLNRRRLAAVALAIALLVGGLGLGTVQAQDGAMPKVNINTADEATLMLLKGIGEAKAKAIVEYREAQPFETIEDMHEGLRHWRENFRKHQGAHHR